MSHNAVSVSNGSKTVGKEKRLSVICQLETARKTAASNATSWRLLR
jgi:hypothetical protein